MNKPVEVHKIVQAYYTEVARNSKSCCFETNSLYPSELLQSLPDDIAGFTAGSGDPVTHANLQRGEKVLDLGSGGGLDCFLAANLVGNNGHVIGVDMTTEMLERARDGAERLHLANIEFREGFLENLPVEDNSIDVVISNCVINLVTDKKQVLHEIYRVLRPGGRLSISDIVTNHAISEEQFQNCEEWCRCVTGALPMKEYIDMLKDVGFINVEIMPDLKVINENIPISQLTQSDNLQNIDGFDWGEKWDRNSKSIFLPCLISAKKKESK
jgi:SAM-dependent methyltransferase